MTTVVSGICPCCTADELSHLLISKPFHCHEDQQVLKSRRPAFRQARPVIVHVLTLLRRLAFHVS